MKKLLIILLLPALFSCTHEQKLKRAKNKLTELVKEFPELATSDTILKRDTTIIPGIKHDTIFKNTITKDTVVIKEKNLEIRYYNDGKTVYLAGEVKTDTIIKEIPVIVNTVTPPVKYIPDFYLYSTWALYILLLLEAGLIWLYIRTKK